MNSIRSKLTYANVMATLAVFIALGGGTTAVALNGSNTVQSDDIGPGAQVKAADIAPAALSKGRAATRQNGCHPTSAAFADCGHVTMSLPRSARVLIVATATWDGDGSFAAGECRIGVDGAPWAECPARQRVGQHRALLPELGRTHQRHRPPRPGIPHLRPGVQPLRRKHVLRLHLRLGSGARSGLSAVCVAPLASGERGRFARYWAGMSQENVAPSPRHGAPA